MQFDVIVAGAGPAGSTAARECAARGLSTLLLEKAEFPRDKPCGGGVTVRAARLLPFSLAPITERVITGMVISVRRRRTVRRCANGPLTYLTQRRHLDTFLAERAVQAGAGFRERIEIRAVERTAAGILVRAGNEVFTGATLIVADGVNGRTGRLAGLQPKRRLTLAMEGNVTPAGAFPSDWEHSLGIDAGQPAGGYGWIFPKGDHLNIGVASWPALGASLRDRLHHLTHSYGFDPGTLWGVRGYHLPVRQAGSPLLAGAVMLVGDAAGLLDPFSLEGIHGAIWSGGAAARHVAAYLSGESRDLEGYQREVDAMLQPELEVARQLYDLSWLVGWGAWLGAARYLPGSANVLWRLLRGDQTYTGIKARLGALDVALDLASDVVRTAPWLRHRAYLAEAPAPARFFRSACPSLERDLQ